MIPSFYLDDWRQQVPWINSSQVEQDLIISRALVNLYESPEVKKSLLFRGGTALHKIHVFCVKTLLKYCFLLF